MKRKRYSVEQIIRMTMRYSRLAHDHMRRAVQVLDAPAEVPSGDILEGHYLDTKGWRTNIRMSPDKHNTLFPLNFTW